MDDMLCNRLDLTTCSRPKWFIITRTNKNEVFLHTLSMLRNPFMQAGSSSMLASIQSIFGPPSRSPDRLARKGIAALDTPGRMGCLIRSKLVGVVVCDLRLTHPVTLRLALAAGVCCEL